jgi:hypothetical protein
MLDVGLLTTDGRWLVIAALTPPEPAQAILLHKLQLSLSRATATANQSQIEPTRPRGPVVVVPTFLTPLLKRQPLGRAVRPYCESQVTPSGQQRLAVSTRQILPATAP